MPQTGESTTAKAKDTSKLLLVMWPNTTGRHAIASGKETAIPGPISDFFGGGEQAAARTDCDWPLVELTPPKPPFAPPATPTLVVTMLCVPPQNTTSRF